MRLEAETRRWCNVNVQMTRYASEEQRRRTRLGGSSINAYSMQGL